jgi:hypothetical protein
MELVDRSSDGALWFECRGSGALYLVCTKGATGWQDAEKIRQLCSRVAQALNVRQRISFGPSLAAAALDGLFEHPVPVSVK